MQFEISTFLERYIHSLRFTYSVLSPALPLRVRAATG
jgi:hypothetical protein